MRLWLPLLLTLTSASHALEHADLTYNFYAYPPFAIVSGGEHTGYMSDLMRAVLERTGMTVAVVDTPVARAVGDTERTANSFTAGTATREMQVKQKLRWLFCFETVSHELIVKRSTGYGDTLDAVPRTAAVGAFISYTLKDYLAEKGFKRLEFARENPLLADMLMADRIDAWASLGPAARYIMEQKNLDFGRFRAVPVKDVPFCAATSLSTPPVVVDWVRAAYREIVADGTRRKIRDRYARYLGPDRPVEALSDLPLTD